MHSLQLRKRHSTWENRVCGGEGSREKPRKLQVYRHDQLRALGYKIFVLDDLGQIGGIIDAIQTA